MKNSRRFLDIDIEDVMVALEHTSDGNMEFLAGSSDFYGCYSLWKMAMVFILYQRKMMI